jgi:hypothetical protein
MGHDSDGLGFRVQGLGFRVEGLGDKRVQNMGHDSDGAAGMCSSSHTSGSMGSTRSQMQAQTCRGQRKHPCGSDLSAWQVDGSPLA